MSRTYDSHTDPYKAAISCFTRRAVSGETPPVDTAICRSPRRTTDGMTKLHSSGVPTTLTSIPRSSASEWTAQRTSSEPAAHIASSAPSRSPRT
jgi:hypothetical protein